MNIADVCKRLQTEIDETLPSITVAAPTVVTSFKVVSDDYVFEEKKNGFEESIAGHQRSVGVRYIRLTTSRRTAKTSRTRRLPRRHSFET